MVLLPVLGTSAIWCGPGQYALSLGGGTLSVCTLCPIGTYQPSFADNPACVAVPANYETADGATLVCARTYYLTGSVCVAIPPGWRCIIEMASGCTSVIPCPIGYYGAIRIAYPGVTAASYCQICAAGTSSVTGSVSCPSCSNGTYSISGGVCCPLGQTARLGTSCSPCDAGTKGNTNALCSSCPSGQWSGSGATACSQCVAGTYAPTSGTPQCFQCSPGTYTGSMGSTTCVSCAINTYSVSGQASCTPCSAERYSAAGSGSCIVCPTGQTSISGNFCKQVCPFFVQSEKFAQAQIVPNCINFADSNLRFKLY